MDTPTAEQTKTPYTCDTCGTVVTDHDLSEDTVTATDRKYNLLCEPCFDALPVDVDEAEDNWHTSTEPWDDPYKFYGVSRHDFY